MKNTTKKLTSLAIAFTILGTGTAVTKAIAPKSDNTLIASAADNESAKKGISFLGWLGELFDPFWGGSNAYTETSKAANKVVDKATERYDYYDSILKEIGY